MFQINIIYNNNSFQIYNFSQLGFGHKANARRPDLISYSKVYLPRLNGPVLDSG